MITLGQTIPYTEITLMQVIVAIIVLIIGWLGARLIIGLFKRELAKTNLPELSVEFLGRLFSVLLYVVVILLAVRALGIAVSSVVLGLSAVLGLVLGFGMQDTLTNVFAGIWLAALRPIDKDEVVTTNGQTGIVSAVGMMATELLTFDNKCITIPNKLVWGSPIINFTRMPTRRVDVDVGVSYATDLDRAIPIAMALMKGHALVLDDPAPTVAVLELADSSVNLQLRAWAKTADWWTVLVDLRKAVLEAYRREAVEIPFPQMDVHLKHA
ncbi:MAG: mechanosensitive ion channel family protein [Candidatus Methanospirareceae archaeon]